MGVVQRTLVTAGATAGLLLAILVALNAHSFVRGAIVSVGVEQAGRDHAAPNFELRDLDGNTVALRDYEGQRFLLAFWAAWNRESVGRLSDLNILAQAGWRVVAVNLMEDSDRAMAAAGRVRFPILLDTDGRVGRLYGVEETPSVFLIQADGSVATLGADLPEPIWLVAD